MKRFLMDIVDASLRIHCLIKNFKETPSLSGVHYQIKINDDVWLIKFLFLQLNSNYLNVEAQTHVPFISPDSNVFNEIRIRVSVNGCTNEEEELREMETSPEA